MSKSKVVFVPLEDRILCCDGNGLMCACTPTEHTKGNMFLNSDVRECAQEFLRRLRKIKRQDKQTPLVAEYVLPLIDKDFEDCFGEGWESEKK